MEYSLRMFPVGEAAAPGPLLFFLSHWDEWITAPHSMWLAQGEGHTILINTGLPQDPEDLEILNTACRGVHPKNFFASDKIRPPQDLLAEIGVKPGDVDQVLLISMASYATGNVELFPHADIHMSRKGWADFVAPERPPTFDREVIFTDATMTYLYTKAWNRIHLVDNEEEVLPGIKMFWVGCHHHGSMAVSIPTAKGRVVISDAIFRYENFEKGTPIGCAQSIFEFKDGLDRVREEADIVIPMHDYESYRKHPEGIIA